MFTQERIDDYYTEQDMIAHLLSVKMRRERLRTSTAINYILAGPSGTGKTSTVQSVCEKYDVPLYEVDGSALVSQMEGQATAPLEDAIIDANENTDAWLTALLIDEADGGGLGRKGSVNNKATQGFAMTHLIKPTEVCIERPNQRRRFVPTPNFPAWFMTTNDLEALPPQIVMPHRSKINVLDPQGEQKTKIIANMYSHLGAEDAAKLADHFADQSLAFFATLKNEAAKGAILIGAEYFKFKFKRVDWLSFANFVGAKATALSVKSLIEAGEKIAAQDRSANFIAPPKPTPKYEVVRRPTRKPRSKTNGAAGRVNGRATKTPETNIAAQGGQ
ncbi:MAG: ATP-binding protein [Pseudomonadota bacterium]